MWQSDTGGGTTQHTCWGPNALCVWLPSPWVTVAGDSGGARPYGAVESLHREWASGRAEAMCVQGRTDAQRLQAHL